MVILSVTQSNRHSQTLYVNIRTQRIRKSSRTDSWTQKGAS